MIKNLIFYIYFLEMQKYKIKYMLILYKYNNQIQFFSICLYIINIIIFNIIHLFIFYKYII